jgi:hypothetical protein
MSIINFLLVFVDTYNNSYISNQLRKMKDIRNILLVLAFICAGCGQEFGGDSAAFPDDRPDDPIASEPNDHLSTATPPTSPDLRGEEIDIYLIGADSEIFSDITESISNGLQDGFAYVNSKGGVFGAEIIYHFIRVSDFNEEMQNVYKDLLREEKPFLILLAAPVSQDFYDLINKNEVPVIHFGIGTSRLGDPEESENYLFWLTPLPDQQMAFVLHEIWKNWSEIRPHGTFNEVKVGYITWQEQYNYLTLTPQTRVFIQRNNYTLEFEAEIPISANTSVTNFLLDAVSSGVTVLYTDTITYGPAVLWNDIHSLGLSDFFVVSGTQWVMGDHVLEYIREPLDSDQIFFPMSTAWWMETDNPAIDRAIAISSSARRDQEELNIGYLLSLGAVDIVVHVLDEIIKENGTGDVSEKDVMHQLSQLDYVVMDGLFTVDYTGGNRSVKEVRLWSYSLGEGMVPFGSVRQVPLLPLVED